MTKQWEAYEATIKDLYAENTLSVVRQIMIEKYGFRASVRAYRGRLIRWGVRKYNCRKRSSSRSSGGSANEAGSSSGEDASSPTMTTTSAGIASNRRTAGGHLAMPGQVNQPYGAMDRGSQGQLYNADNSYESKPKVLLSPPLSQSGGGANNMQYGWDAGSPPLAPDKKLGSASAPNLNGFGGSGVSAGSVNVGVGNANVGVGGRNGHHGEVMAPPSFFGSYGGPVPMNNNPYASAPDAGYDASTANDHRGSGAGSLSYYDMQQRGRDAGQMSDGVPYPSAVRDYGHGG
ncbi:hypothetical protein F5Y05DRAFT_374128 [Hypoxylon sp. FL0543]|nr:hypothetical protein F5Y05DRAFT_374128 [Hypoxylon sp. FL0543]